MDGKKQCLFSRNTKYKIPFAKIQLLPKKCYEVNKKPGEVQGSILVLFCFVLIYKNNRRSQLKYKNKISDTVEVFPCVHAHFPKVKCRSDLNVLPKTIVCGGLGFTTHPLSEERRMQIPLPRLWPI